MLNREALTDIPHPPSPLPAPQQERAACLLYPLASAQPQGVAEPSPGKESGLPGRQTWAQEHTRQLYRQSWHPAAVALNEDARRWRDAEALDADGRTLLGHALSTLLHLDENLPPYPLVHNSDCERYRKVQALAETRRSLACRRLVWALNLSLEALDPLPASRGMSDWQHRQPATDTLPVRLARRIAFEGVLLTPALLQGLALGRQGEMPGVATLFDKMYRDARTHLAFDLALYRRLRDHTRQEGDILPPEALLACLHEALELAVEYAYQSQPRGQLGLNAHLLEAHLRATANACCRTLSLPEPAPRVHDPLDWLTRPSPIDSLDRNGIQP